MINDRKKSEYNRSVAKCCKCKYQVKCKSCTERVSGYPLHKCLTFDIPFLFCHYLFYQIRVLQIRIGVIFYFEKRTGSKKTKVLSNFVGITFSVRLCPSLQHFRNQRVYGTLKKFPCDSFHLEF